MRAPASILVSISNHVCFVLSNVWIKCCDTLDRKKIVSVGLYT